MQRVKVTDQSYKLGKYTGDMINNTPDGFGKWSQGGTVRYEGNWDNGMWTGEGNSYDSDGVICYSGTWKNGEQDGIGTLYNEDLSIIFKGEWKAGKKLKGDIYHSNGNKKYDGQFQSDYKHGFGTEYEEDGTTIIKQGNFYYGKFIGNESLEEHEENLSEEEEQQQMPSTTTSVFTIKSNSDIMSAPIMGLFPRYDAIPSKMQNGATFAEMEDDEIPTPTNLTGTRDDWISWIRKNYPRKTN